MRRIYAIVSSFLLTIVVAIAIAHQAFAERAVEIGRDLYIYRTVLVATPWERPPRASRIITWTGDSTIMHVGRPSFLRLVSERLSDDGVSGVGRAYVGLDFFHYYCLLPHMLDTKPDLLIFVANFRLFERGRRENRAVDLCSAFGFTNLIRATTLPWHDRGITIPRLLLAQTIRWPQIEYWLYLLEGLRRIAINRLTNVELLRSTPFSMRKPANPERPVNKYRRNYNEPLTPAHPVVRMMGATIREARLRGVPVVVVGLPIPHEFLRRTGHWNPETDTMRAAVVRDTVTANGGTFIDLHLALPRKEFRDQAGGHFTEEGVAHLARLLEPTVKQILRSTRANEH